MPLPSYLAVASLVLSSFSVHPNAVPISIVSSTASSYVFNPDATNNLVVYYGSTIKTTTTNLTNLCNNIDIDIVVLTFIHEIIGGGGYPNIDFGVLCSGQTSEMVAADATGLLWCPDLANAIGDCQSIGKKVLVSIGGAKGNVTFTSAVMANQSAQMLWDVFGAGTAYDVNYRPFGDIVVDGSPKDFAITVAQVQSMGFANFGGVALWDGAYGLLTVDSTGNNYVNVTKAALEH